MRITTIQGSPKKKGNTATILGVIEEELHSLGHTTDRIYLNNKTINGCLGCYQCQGSPDSIDCVQNDDADAILQQMVNSDGILFASPVYFWGMSAQLKTLIDRSFSLATQYGTSDHTSLLRDKRVGLLITGEDSQEANACVQPPINNYFDFLMADNKGALYVGECSKFQDLAVQFQDDAKRFAHQLVG